MNHSGISRAIITILSWGHPCISHTGELRIVHSNSDTASPLLSKNEGSPLATCWPCQRSAAQDAAGLPCCDSTVLACSQLDCQDPRILLCKAAFQPGSLYPVCPGAWGYSSSGAGLCTSLCWTSWGSTLLTSSACQSIVPHLLGVSNSS